MRLNGKRPKEQRLYGQRPNGQRLYGQGLKGTRLIGMRLNGMTPFVWPHSVKPHFTYFGLLTIQHSLNVFDICVGLLVLLPSISFVLAYLYQCCAFRSHFMLDVCCWR